MLYRGAQDFQRIRSPYPALTSVFSTSAQRPSGSDVVVVAGATVVAVTWLSLVLVHPVAMSSPARTIGATRPALVLVVGVLIEVEGSYDRIVDVAEDSEV